jgi:hypothetical protein
MNSLTPPALQWCDAAAEPYAWQRANPAPGENRGFEETRTYLFRGPSSGFSLYVDDQPLTPGSDGSGWQWTPGFFAGEVTAELLREGGGSAGLFLLDVAPDPGKMGRDIFHSMVEELWEHDPTLVIGEEPAKTKGGELGTHEDPWAAFARFRRYAPEFLRALRPIRSSPRKSLRVRRVSASLHHVRSVDSRTAISVLRSPAVALFFAHPENAPGISPDSRIDVPSIEETVDSAANRAILALLYAVVRRVHMLLDRLEAIVASERLSETRTPLAARWPIRRAFLQKTLKQLVACLRTHPFNEVQSVDISAAGLTAVSADPLYARAWNRGWRAIRSGMESDISSERLWVSPTWEIYERWCFLQVGKLMATALPEYEWSFKRAPWRLTGVGQQRRAELTLQPRFPALCEPTQGRWSVSRERVPDLLLTISAGGETRFIFLDAKYRTSRRNVLEAMESAHIYQDSLRIGRVRAEASLLLVPEGSQVSWLCSPDFIAEHRVGVCPLLPGQNFGALVSIIQNAFGL